MGGANKNLANFGGKQILIVEGEREVAKVLLEAFTVLNGAPLVAHTFENALALVKEKKFDGIICDGQNGEALFENFLPALSCGPNSETPVILQTSRQDFPFEDAYVQGIHSFLVKPFRVSKIVSLAERFFLNPGRSKRIDTRHRSLWTIEVSPVTQSVRYRARVLNYSKSGLFIAPLEHFEFYKGQHFKIYVGETEEECRLQNGNGFIVWVSRWEESGVPNGMGIRIVQATPELKTKLQQSPGGGEPDPEKVL